MENEIRNETVQTPEEKVHYSSFRYAIGAILAFFGFSNKTHHASQKRAKLVGDIFVYIILLFGAFIMIYPFWWMLAGSFAYTSNLQIVNGGKAVLHRLVWWPDQSTANSTDTGISLFYNYKIMFTKAFVQSDKSNFAANYSYWRALLNNLIYSIVPVVVGVITSASAAFSFAKINWFGRNQVFFFLLAAIMVPGASITSTQYAMYTELNMTNNWSVMVVPGLFGSIMTAFFIRQFLFGLPTSIIEAAKIDGAGYFRIFVSFILPLAMPAIMAQALLSFMGCWNNYVGSYLFIRQDSEWINMTHAMQVMSNGAYSEDQGPVIAASVMCVLPVLILFACFQKLIIGSLMLTGSKE
ncbi:MAG: carbohydrate ABC transporter permease [Clostridia bacterium]|nr:carbohydrate ABC transporter permease [Clostridia bacterium]